MKTEFLYRRNTVREALRGRRRPLFRLWLEQKLDKRVAQELTAAATAIRLPIEIADKDKLGKLAQDRGHQGVVLECGPYQYADVDEMLGRARQLGDKPFLLLLDQVQGPQNMGILLRTAEACGVHGIIMQDRNAPDITPTIVMASAGATEHLPIAKVTNMVVTMKQLKEKGVWLAGLDVAPDAYLPGQIDLNRPLALVVGHEGEGLRRLVGETCDFLLQLPMRGRVESLNASAAGSVMMYLAWQARGFAGFQSSKP